MGVKIVQGLILLRSAVTSMNARVSINYFEYIIPHYTYSPTHHSKISLTILETTYVQISASYFCEHANGGIPYRCLERVPTKCKEECNRLYSCVGYTTGSSICYLFPSDESCPSGWSKYTGTVATDSSQLVYGTGFSGNCYRKGNLH